MQIISRKEAQERGLKRYYTGKPCKHGHISPRAIHGGSCLECAGIRKRAKTKAKVITKYPHKIISKDSAKAIGLTRYFTGKACKHGHVCERFTSTSICVECNALNSSYRRSIDPGYMKQYREKNRERLNRRNATIPERKMAIKMREMIRRVMRSIRQKKKARTDKILNYTAAEFVESIESKFTDGMSWDNHGEWHIDHIIPVSVLIERGETDPNVINALSNLQPLWAADNLKKSARIKNPS